MPQEKDVRMKHGPFLHMAGLHAGVHGVHSPGVDRFWHTHSQIFSAT